jgi:quinol monooxygenase YgiN
MARPTSPSGPVTVINVFTVEPAKQRELVELLVLATDGFVIHVPGFLSSTLHRSLDGTKVTMVAQWRSVRDYQAMRAGPALTRLLEKALTLARFEPGMYEVVKQFTPAG